MLSLLKLYRRCTTVRLFSTFTQFGLDRHCGKLEQRQWYTLRHEHHGKMQDNASEEGRIISSKQIQFVPDSGSVNPDDIDLLAEFITTSKHLVVLTGAGLSTESGIPDYRSAGVGLYARTSHRPIQYQQFLHDSKARQRYWARNFIGWPHFSTREPNSAHLTLGEWERTGAVKYLVTQNVDELHRKAGSCNVTELHGSTHRVTCLSCDATMTRSDLQRLFIVANEGWRQCSEVASGTPQMAPDGDVLLTDEEVKHFKVPKCPSCGTGILKPDVIFFGDNVPISVVNSVYGQIDQSDALLVIGSSLFVYSGYRFVLRASEKRARIAIVNIGPTRADHLADVRVNGRCGLVLPSVQL